MLRRSNVAAHNERQWPCKSIYVKLKTPTIEIFEFDRASADAL